MDREQKKKRICSGKKIDDRGILIDWRKYPVHLTLIPSDRQLSIDKNAIIRYERCLTGVVYYTADNQHWYLIDI